MFGTTAVKFVRSGQAPADVSSIGSAGITTANVWRVGDEAGFTAAYAAQLVAAGWVTLV
jgi:hypothetical protein